MGLRKIRKIFENGNTCVVGLRGDGKDMLMSNIVVRRGIPYISNTEYASKAKKPSKRLKFHPLDISALNCGENTYKDFISGEVKYYDFPYDDGTDVYIADVGVYFPAQYCNELNRDYKYLPTFLALSRHLGMCNVHFNVQQLTRAWDKLREQSDQYIRCTFCIVIGGIVIQKVIIYDEFDSCAKRVPPFNSKLPLLAKKEMKNLLQIEKMKYTLQYGKIKPMLLIYRNKSSYDTRVFKEMLKNGKKDTEN